MKKFDPIIYDSNSGFDIGFLIEVKPKDEYFFDNCNHHVNLVTGIFGELFLSNSEIKEFNEKTFSEVIKKYGAIALDYNQMLNRINNSIEEWKHK